MSQLGRRWEEGAPIRVLIANLPGAFGRAVVELVREQADMQLAGPVNGNIDTLLAAAKGTDVIIVGASQVAPLPAICTHLLGEFTDLRIIILGAGDEAVAKLYWLGLRRQEQHVGP